MQITFKAPESLPVCFEAEQAVLGCVLSEPTLWDELASATNEEYFYAEKHKHIYHAMQTLAEQGKPIDTLTVSNCLDVNGLIDSVGGYAHVYELSQCAPSSFNFYTYLEVLSDRAIKRGLVQATHTIALEVGKNDGTSADDLREFAEKAILSVGKKIVKSEDDDISIILDKVVQGIKERQASGSSMTGIPTGIKSLDRHMFGMQRGDLIILAARPSMGKTACALNIALHVAIETKKKVIIFSLEMSEEQIVLRLLSLISGVEHASLSTGENLNWALLASGIEFLKNSQLKIKYQPGMKASEMRTYARVEAKDCEIGLIVVDYIQMMEGGKDSETRNEQISKMSRSLKAMAGELKTPVIALSQLNRKVEDRINKRPVPSDLRDSGALEQDADVIAFLYRDCVYNPEASKTDAELILAKMRNNSLATIELEFQGRYMKFTDKPGILDDYPL